MQLVVGTDSTWSLRAWICAQLAEITVTVKIIDLKALDYKAQILKYSPTGLVPALKIAHGYVHDSFAIAEFFNERANGALYPRLECDRALSRSLCAEMHSGFINLRSACPFTLDDVEPLVNGSDSISNDIRRLDNIFAQAQLPFMFKSAGVVDAFYSILAYRLHKYGVVLTGKAGEYQQCLLNWITLQAAIEQANVWRKI